MDAKLDAYEGLGPTLNLKVVVVREGGVYWAITRFWKQAPVATIPKPKATVAG